MLIKNVIWTDWFCKSVVSKNKFSVACYKVLLHVSNVSFNTMAHELDDDQLRQPVSSLSASKSLILHLFTAVEHTVLYLVLELL